MCLCPFTDLNLCTGDYRLPWKSFALAAFIQLFFFLKGSDLRQWCCSYVTCRALAVLKLLSCPNLACGDVSVAGTLGEPLGGLRTGPALGTASWQLRVKLGSAHFQQQLSRALRQIYFHLSSWYSIFCLREFIQTKIWFFFFWYCFSFFPHWQTSQPDCELHLISFGVSWCQFQTVPSIHKPLGPV